MVMFKNREEAGRLLAARLKELLEASADFAPAATVVVALPRGGVPVAAQVSKALGCEIDLLVSKKIRAPDNPEFAIGAVSSGGIVVLDEHLPGMFGHRAQYQEAQRVQKEELIVETCEQERMWAHAAGMGSRPDWADKHVIVVDDGIATGMTTRAALRTVRQRRAAKIWLGTPVVPQDVYWSLHQECDRVIALSTPHDFSAVGLFYHDFHQVEDAEVVAALKSSLAVEK